MNIGTRKAGQATILDLDGPLKLGEAEESFRNQIQQLVDTGSTHVAVNLAGVTELDSSGIGALVRAFTTLKRAGGKCTYFSPNKRVVMLLKMVRLDTVLDISRRRSHGAHPYLRFRTPETIFNGDFSEEWCARVQATEIADLAAIERGMPDVAARHEINNVFGNVGGVISNTFDVFRH